MTEKDEKAPLTPGVPGLKSADSARYRALLAEDRESRRAGTRLMVEETVAVPTTQKSPVTLTVVPYGRENVTSPPGAVVLPFYHSELAVYRANSPYCSVRKMRADAGSLLNVMSRQAMIAT